MCWKGRLLRTHTSGEQGRPSEAAGPLVVNACGFVTSRPDKAVRSGSPCMVPIVIKLMKQIPCECRGVPFR